MANAAPDAQELASLPLFFGNNKFNNYPKGYASPEHFLDRLRSHVDALNIADHQVRIAKIVNQFRGDAQTWWTKAVLNPRYRVDFDKQQTQADYNVFIATFKKEFFKVADYTDTAEDISDLHMKHGEPAREYFKRVRFTRTTMDTIIQDHLETTAYTDAALTAQFGPLINNIINDPAIDAAVRDQIQAAILQTARQVALWAGNQTLETHSYLAMARHIARTAYTEHMRTAIKKEMYQTNFDIQALQRIAEQDEKSHATPTRRAAELAAATDDVEDEDNTDDAYGYDMEDECEVSAVGRGRGRGRGGRGGRGRGRGSHVARGGFYGTNQHSSTGASGADNKTKSHKRPPFCLVCNAKVGHRTKDCPKLKQIRETAGVPMDTSAMAPAAIGSTPSTAQQLEHISQALQQVGIYSPHQQQQPQQQMPHWAGNE